MSLLLVAVPLTSTKDVWSKKYCGDTALTAPPFFDNVIRGANHTWDANREGPLVINWTGLGAADKELLKPQLASTNG